MIETLLAISPATYLTFYAACIALNLTPGSDVMFITASGAAGGRRAGLAAGMGISVGSLLHTVLAVLGVATLIQSSTLAYDMLRYCGAAYLVWLAISMWRAPAPRPGIRGSSSIRRAFLRGMANCALNPKVSIFVLAFLPQFADPEIGPIWQQIAIFGVIFSVGSIPVNAAWGLAAGWLGGPIRRMGRGMNRISAVVFAGLAARLAFE